MPKPYQKRGRRPPFQKAKLDLLMDRVSNGCPPTKEDVLFLIYEKLKHLGNFPDNPNMQKLSVDLLGKLLQDMQGKDSISVNIDINDVLKG